MKERLNGYSFELSWEHDGENQNGKFIISIEDGVCTIDQIKGENLAVCLYNQPWKGLEDLVCNLHEQGLEDIETHLWDTFGSSGE